MKMPKRSLQKLQRQMRSRFGDLDGIDEAIAAAIERLPEDTHEFLLFLGADRKGNIRVESLNDLSETELEHEGERIQQLIAEKDAQRRLAALRQKGLKRSQERPKRKANCTHHGDSH